MRFFSYGFLLVFLFAGCATTGSNNTAQNTYYSLPAIDTLQMEKVQYSVYLNKINEFKYKLSVHYNYSSDYYPLYHRADSLEQAAFKNQYKIVDKGVKKGFKTGLVLGTFSSFLIYTVDDAIDNVPLLFIECFGASILVSCGIGYLISTGVVAKRQLLGGYMITSRDVATLNNMIKIYNSNIQ